MPEITETMGQATEEIGKIWKIIDMEGIIRAGLMFIIGAILIRYAMRLTDKLLSRFKNIALVRVYIRSTINISLWVVLIMIVLDSFGVPITSLVALLGVFGLAVSLALQNTLSNLAGGIQVLVTKPFEVGDYIDTQHGNGTVTEIGLAYSKLVTVDNKAVLIPNSQIASSNIVNYTSTGMRRVDITVTASYDAPTKVVKQAAMEAVDKFPQVKMDPAPPVVWLSEYQSSAIAYVIRAWVDVDDYWTVYFGIMEELRNTFEAHDVEMTYNHLNVHMGKH